MVGLKSILQTYDFIKRRQDVKGCSVGGGGRGEGRKRRGETGRSNVMGRMQYVVA